MDHRELIEAGQQEWMLDNGTVMLWALMSVDQLRTAAAAIRDMAESFRASAVVLQRQFQFPLYGDMTAVETTSPPEALHAEALIFEHEAAKMERYADARERIGYVLSGPIPGLAEIRPPRGFFK